MGSIEKDLENMKFIRWHAGIEVMLVGNLVPEDASRYGRMIEKQLGGEIDLGGEYWSHTLDLEGKSLVEVVEGLKKAAILNYY